MKFVSELRRRNVFRMAALYAVAAWLIVQVAGVLIDLAKLPDWIGTTTLLVLSIGFPISLIFSWFFQITPEGIGLETDSEPDVTTTHLTARRLDILVISLLCSAIILFAYDKWGKSDPPDRTIAVLPFISLSDDPEQEYFADGLSEELLNLLAKIPQLRVTSRSSAFYYKGKDIRVADIGRELGVSHVLDGSVRRSGDEIRVAVQLINTSSDEHLWSETWDREFRNIFAIQDEIGAAVATALKIQLVDELPSSYVTDPEAYALYLQALQHADNLSESRLEMTEYKLQQALAIDPDYAPAIALLGTTVAEMGAWNFRALAESYEQARLLGRRAVETDPNFAGGYMLLGEVAERFDNDIETAWKFYDDALAIDPSNLNAKMHIAAIKMLFGDAFPILAAARQRVKVDPLSASSWRILGHAAMYSGELDESIRAFKRMAILDPDSMVKHATLAEAYFLAGKYEQALAEFEAEPIEGFRYYGRALAHYELDNQQASDSALAQLIEIDENQWAAQIAMVHAVRGDLDEAFRWLDIGLARHDQGLGISAVNPFLENLYGDPRFERFLDKVRSGGL